jgi:hypothetical protein
MNLEPKNCGICGGEGHLVCRNTPDNEKYTVRCEEHECSNETAEFYVPTLAIEAWNAQTDRQRIEKIELLALKLFADLHGRKMDGPRNQTERVLLDITDYARQVLNHGPD